MQRTIRRGRKKKIIRTYKDQEELATDKLFEISHYCEQKFQDQSKMLVQDTDREKKGHKDQNIQSKIQRNGVFSRQRLKIRQRQGGLKQYRTIQMTQIMDKVDQSRFKINKTIENIFNTIESKQVFVGLKKQISQPKHFNPQTDKILEFKPRKRVETMPVSNKNVQPASIKITARQPRSQTLDGRLSHKIKCLNSRNYMDGGVDGDRKLLFEFYQGFKQKLRNNIFGFSERKIGLNFF